MAKESAHASTFTPQMVPRKQDEGASVGGAIAMSIESHYFEFDGERLFYLRAGEGPLVVLCHGFPGLSFSWRYQLSSLAANGHRDRARYARLRAERSSIDVRAYDNDRQRERMLRLLDALGEERAVFVGHDFGAQLCWEIAQRSPSACAGLYRLRFRTA
ncbi:MAG: alpha/beta hydrolase [Polyangiales bacterium]